MKKIPKSQLQLVENPFTGLSEEKVAELRARIATENAEIFSKTCARLSALVAELDPVVTLGWMGLRRLESGGETEEDRSRPGYLHQFLIELLQAICVAVPKERTQGRVPNLNELGELNTLLDEASYSFAMRRINDRPENRPIASVEYIRVHTQIIRNVGYKHQAVRVLTELFQPLDKDVEAECGIAPSRLIAFLQRILKTVVERVNLRTEVLRQISREKRMAGLVRKYYQLTGSDRAEAKKMLELCRMRKYNREQAYVILGMYHTQAIWECFCFTLEELQGLYPAPRSDGLYSVLEGWSLRLGELSGRETDHFFMANPIWEKPFIRLTEETFFCPIPELLHSFAHRQLEGFVGRFPRIMDRYRKVVRPNYLEDAAEQLFRNAFPRARILRNVYWVDSSDGKKYENDLLVQVDSCLILVECKSASIRQTGRRGGQALDEAMKELMESPSKQSERFCSFLLNERRVVELEDENGSPILFDTQPSLQVIRLNLILEALGPLGLLDDFHKAVKNAWPPPSTIALTDLENVFEILDSPHQKIHYLLNRPILHQAQKLMADELDLLAYYLETGFIPMD